MNRLRFSSLSSFGPTSSTRYINTALNRTTSLDSISSKPFPDAWEAVYKVKSEVVDVFSAEGASHLQLGKAYHYQSALKSPARDLIIGIKAALDPKGIMNPGVLGLS